MKKTALSVIVLTTIVFTSCTRKTGTYTDSRDGKVYKTVKIGKQVWMVENLAYKPTSGNYWAYNNKAENIAFYGYLYDWQTALNVCPTGWHLPSDTEWTKLTNILGGKDAAGGKLKATGTIQTGTGLWTYPNSDATNKTGFTALPGGYRNCGGTFGGIGRGGNWWSATEDGNAWIRSIYYTVSPVTRNLGSKDDGFSVRCLQD